MRAQGGCFRTDFPEMTRVEARQSFDGIGLASSVGSVCEEGPPHIQETFWSFVRMLTYKSKREVDGSFSRFRRAHEVDRINIHRKFTFDFRLTSEIRDFTICICKPISKCIKLGIKNS